MSRSDTRYNSEGDRAADMDFQTSDNRYHVTLGFPLGTLVGIVVIAAIFLLIIRWNKAR